MNSKNIFIKITALCAILSFPLYGNINNTDKTDAHEKAQQELQKLKDFYKELIKDYDKELIDQYEITIKKEQEQYIAQNLENPIHIQDTQPLINATKNLLAHMFNLTHSNDAYALTSMIFMINWSNTMNKIVSNIIDEHEKMILQAVNNEIKKIIDMLFLNPMEEQIEQKKRMKMKKNRPPSELDSELVSL